MSHKYMTSLWQYEYLQRALLQFLQFDFPPSDMTSILILPVAVVCAYLVLRRSAHPSAKRAARLFPGPTPLPFFGNVLSLPSNKVWIKLSELARIHGKYPFGLAVA